MNKKDHVTCVHRGSGVTLSTPDRFNIFISQIYLRKLTTCDNQSTNLDHHQVLLVLYRACLKYMALLADLFSQSLNEMMLSKLDSH